MTVLYDAAVLVGADRDDRVTWAKHHARLTLGVLPVTTAPVLAQATRSPRQVMLRRLLRGCDVLPFDSADAHDVGQLLGRSGTSDVVDGHLMLVAERLGALVVTADVDDLGLLAEHVNGDVRIVRA